MSALIARALLSASVRALGGEASVPLLLTDDLERPPVPATRRERPCVGADFTSVIGVVHIGRRVIQKSSWAVRAGHLCGPVAGLTPNSRRRERRSLSSNRLHMRSACSALARPPRRWRVGGRDFGRAQRHKMAALERIALKLGALAAPHMPLKSWIGVVVRRRTTSRAAV